MGSKASGFPVVVKRKEVVAAVLPMQEHWLPMSNLDLLLPPLEVGVFFCYKKSQKPNCHETSNDENWMVSALKKALAQALVSFYALAGEIVNNQLGEPELLCNNRGVDFIHANADVELKHLDLHHPDASVHGKLVPALYFNGHGVLSVQATELKCGGLVVGCTFDHRVADAHSANMFFAAWAEIAAAAKPICHHNHLPSFRRSLLTPRRPPPPPTSHNQPSLIDNMYILLSSLPPPSPPNEAAGELKTRIYYIDSEQINRLQSIASSSAGGEVIKKRSKLESFSAFLWKLIATGGDDPNKRCKLGVVIDGRERLMSRSSSPSSINTTMENYFGNVLSVPFGEVSVGELKAMELGEVAEAVHEFVAVAATEEHFRGLIDWVELHRPEMAIVRVYCKLGSDDEAAVVVSSGQRFPVSKIDFGWGSPAFGSYHFPWGGQTGYVMPMPSTSRDGDWVVYMHLLQKQLDLVESLAPHMFKPLTPAYLNLL